MKNQLSEERIYMRTNIATKRFLEVAATISGYNNLTSFVLTSAYKEAQRIINESQARILSDRDRDLILNILNDPPEPNKRLQNLLLTTKARINQDQSGEQGVKGIQ